MIRQYTTPYYGKFRLQKAAIISLIFRKCKFVFYISEIATRFSCDRNLRFAIIESCVLTCYPCYCELQLSLKSVQWKLYFT